MPATPARRTPLPPPRYDRASSAYIIAARQSAIRIGIVANYSDGYETRMLLTPEACGMLTSGGIKVCMESGAGSDISFPDEKYAEYGVRIVTRDEALSAPVVLCYTPLKAKDIKKMQKGAALLCMMDNILFEHSTVKARISTISLVSGFISSILSFISTYLCRNLSTKLTFKFRTSKFLSLASLLLHTSSIYITLYNTSLSVPFSRQSIKDAERGGAPVHDG